MAGPAERALQLGELAQRMLRPEFGIQASGGKGLSGPVVQLPFSNPRQIVPSIPGGLPLGLASGRDAPATLWWENNSNVKFWFRPELTSYNDGDLVPDVPDSSPHGNNGTSAGVQRTTFKTNIFGTLPALLGNGSTTEYFADAVAASFSGTDVPFYYDALVYQPTFDLGFQSTLFNLSNATDAIHDMYYGGFRGSVWTDRYDNGFLRVARDLGADLDTDRHLIQYRYQGDRHQFWRDGKLVWDVPTKSGTLTFTGFRGMSHTRPSLVVNGSFKGYVGETMLAQMNPSDSQVGARGQWLADRAGLSYSSGDYPWRPYSERNGFTNYEVFCWVRDDTYGDVANGANVPSWFSKTPFGAAYSLEEFTQQAVGAGPLAQDAAINGRRAASFAIGRYMNGHPLAAGFNGTGQPWTVWYTIKLSSNTTRYILWSLLNSTLANPAVYSDFSAASNFIWLRQQNDGLFGTTSLAGTTTNVLRVVERYDGSALSVWHDGVQVVNQFAYQGGLFTADLFRLGAFGAGVVPYVGLVGEFGAANLAWSGSKLTNLLNYQAEWWT